MGDFDLYVMLAERHHWTPEQIDRFDPDFVEELMAHHTAKAENEAADAKKREREQANRRRR